jgi:hypothetical protein
MGLYLRRLRADRRHMVRGPALRPLRASRFKRGRNRLSAESLATRIAFLVGERQELRAAGSPPAAIERNRVQLARAQWELAHALIDEHLAETPAQTAA